VKGPSETSRGLPIAILLLGMSANAAPARCEHPAGTAQIESAFETIRRSIDPCGESGQLVDLLDRFERCAARYHISIDLTASRNLLQPRGVEQTGTIIWNPELRSELEAGCDGDATREVTRDPVASLLHELVHAVDDCEGRDAASRELDAVRLENVYRRPPASASAPRTAIAGSTPYRSTPADGTPRRSHRPGANRTDRARRRGLPPTARPRRPRSQGTGAIWTDTLAS
jgi:hypothetical protein